MPLQIPQVTAAETVDEIVAVSKRPSSFPLRYEFLRQPVDDGFKPGPLAPLVKASDHRALLLYLLLLTKACSAPWDSALPAAVWARALDLPLPESKSARSTISKIWLRLERQGLVKRGTRHKRRADVFLLREDGYKDEYTSPGEAGERYFSRASRPVAGGSSGYDEAVVSGAQLAGTGGAAHRTQPQRWLSAAPGTRAEVVWHQRRHGQPWPEQPGQPRPDLSRQELEAGSALRDRIHRGVPLHPPDTLRPCRPEERAAEASVCSGCGCEGRVQSGSRACAAQDAPARRSSGLVDWPEAPPAVR